MIQLVHWKSFVTPDFMQNFVRIEKRLAAKKRFGTANEEEAAIERSEPDNYRTWAEIRWKMRHAGYESKKHGSELLWRERGWYGTADIIGDELKFRYFADSSEAPVFISVAQLMQFKEEINQDGIEKSYYGDVKDYVNQAKPTNGSGHKTYRVAPKPRADLDGFTHEEA